MKVLVSLFALAVLLAPLGVNAQSPGHDNRAKISCASYNRHTRENANLFADRQSQFESGIRIGMFSDRLNFEFGAKRQSKRQAGEVVNHLEHSVLASVTFRF